MLFTSEQLERKWGPVRQVYFAGCRLKQLVYLSQSRINPSIEANSKQRKLIQANRSAIQANGSAK